MNKTYVIAEAGVNHNGSIDLAKKLVEAAASAGADAVKFQSFRADKLVQRDVSLSPYQKQTVKGDDTQSEMLARLELSEDDHFALAAVGRECEIDVLSSPFDLESLAFLCDRLKLTTIKVPSGELTNAPYLYEIGKRGVDVIVSTGMATMDEIGLALDVLAYAYLGHDTPKSIDDVVGFSQKPEGAACLGQRVTLLHCTTEYPAPINTINLKAMDTLRDAFGLAVGYSDHSEGIHVPVAAVARGAVVLEKHMTLSRDLEGPDHKASLEVEAFAQMVRAVRDIEVALGDGDKKPFEEELVNRKFARKGLFAARDIDEGDVLGADDILVLRPEAGTSPKWYWDVLGKPARKAFKKNDPIER